MASNRTWLFVLAAPLAALGLLVALVLAVLWSLRPAPADEELAEWVAQREETDGERVLAVRTGGGPAGDCGIEVVVSAGGQPLEGAAVSVQGMQNSLVLAEHHDRSDTRGTAVFSDLPCIATTVRAEAPGLVASFTDLNLHGSTGETRVELRLDGGMVLRGQVIGSDGDPVPEARVSSYPGAATTDENGHYELIVPPMDRIWLRAEAFGYQPRSEETRLDDPRPGQVVEVDIELEAVRQVRVFCAGLPDDDCGDVFLSCTEPFVPFGESCRRWRPEDDMVCTCPEGKAAVRGGGRSVLIDADDEEAWLDFRDTGTIVGSLTYDGEPAPGCQVTVVRIPNGLEDLPRGGFAARRAQSDLDGQFELLGVVEGDWQLEIQCLDPYTGDNLERSSTPMAVRPRQETDAGNTELLGGGGIEGVLLDGLTGEPIPHHPVMALREAAGAERRAPALADTNRAGEFSMSGLPPGRWTLAHPLSPHQSTSVLVEDGVITDGIVIETSDATALVENGFTVSAEGDDIVVSGVEQGGPAWEAGLLEGDVVDGVLIAGFDVGSMLGELEPNLTRLVLGQWDGPGVTLVVDRDGELVEVPLDW